MNTRLRAFVVGLVVVMSVGTLGAAVATATTLRPRTVMLEKLNEVRSAHGLHAVRPALLLRLTAQRHSDDMVIRDYFSHTSPGGSTLLDRITKSGAIILSPTWSRIGISRACGRFLGHAGACVWTADWVKRW
jgi:cysteine-rich secretory family protein